MLDPAFLRPIAHRGLHDTARGIVENTIPAFDAAIAKGYGIECDLVPARGGLPVVFHDDTLDRLTEETGPVARLGPEDLARIRFKACDTVGIPTFAEALAHCGPRVPLLIEIKSDWRPPPPAFLQEIARLARDHEGPIALISFDPALMAAIAGLAPGIPRGLVSGGYRNRDGTPWWPELSRWRTFCLRNLLEDRGAPPDFYAYQVDALPTLATRFARWRNRPILAWTVRTEEQRRTAALHADAPVFEGYEP